MRVITSYDLKILSIANGGQFVFLPFSDGKKMIISVFHLLIIKHKQTLYDDHFFPNSSIFDDILLRY